MLQKQESKELQTFPANADVRIIISGLAFCQFVVGESRINFLRHIPYHELIIKIIKKRRGSGTPIETFIRQVPLGRNITIKPENAVRRTSLKGQGERSLNELINFNENDLHKGDARLKDPLPPIQPPTVLIIHDCVFYTAAMSDKRFHIKKRGTPAPIRTKYIGHSLGGKIRYANSTGRTIITLGSEQLQELPKMDAGGNEFVYDIFLTNHCGDETSTSDPLHDLCENLMGNDTDFRFYYDLLEDKTDKTKKFTLEKDISSKAGDKTIADDKTADVGACNVAILDPPIIPPGEEP
jgi:hypothetical protein